MRLLPWGIGSGVAKLVDGASAHAEDKPLPQLESQHIAENAEEDQRAYERERNALYEGLLANVEEQSTLGAPVETKLYDELGVRPDATPSEIRRAYFRLAQRYHPDKNPNDPQATEKFQIIADAYQILSDPVKREEYHRVGRTESETLLDPKSLFVLMFGNDKFAHIVGDLATATLLGTMSEKRTATAPLLRPKIALKNTHKGAKSFKIRGKQSWLRFFVNALTRLLLATPRSF